MSEPELMPAGFSPVRTGRKPLVDAGEITEALSKLTEEGYHKRWVSYSTYSVPEVRSLYSQLKREGYQVRTGENGRVLFVRVP